MLNVVVGSTSRHKLDAIRNACAELGIDADVLGVRTISGQHEQPSGLDETIAGALRRANEAQKAESGSTAIGIESGIIINRFPIEVVIDLAVVVILTPEGKRIITTSAGIEFPSQDASTAFGRGFSTTTVGSVIAERTGCDPTDPHAYLTNGKVSRAKLLTDAVVAALAQLGL